MEILNLIIDKKKKVYNRNEKVIVVGNAGNSKEISFKREEIGKKVPQDIVVVDPIEVWKNKKFYPSPIEHKP